MNDATIQGKIEQYLERRGCRNCDIWSARDFIESLAVEAEQRIVELARERDELRQLADKLEKARYDWKQKAEAAERDNAQLLQIRQLVNDEITDPEAILDSIRQLLGNAGESGGEVSRHESRMG